MVWILITRQCRYFVSHLRDSCFLLSAVLWSPRLRIPHHSKLFVAHAIMAPTMTPLLLHFYVDRSRSQLWKGRRHRLLRTIGPRVRSPWSVALDDAVSMLYIWFFWGEIAASCKLLFYRKPRKLGSSEQLQIFNQTVVAAHAKPLGNGCRCSVDRWWLDCVGYWWVNALCIRSDS